MIRRIWRYLRGNDIWPETWSELHVHDLGSFGFEPGPSSGRIRIETMHGPRLCRVLWVRDSMTLTVTELEER